MGTFLALSAVVDRGNDIVRDAIAAYVGNVGGTFEPREGTAGESNTCIIGFAEKSTSVLYPDDFTEWDDLSQFLSTTLKTPVFSFHIHDGDLWMLIAFDNGREVGWFNPIPDYWGDVSSAEREKWSGDANVVAQLIPGITPASIENYFCSWSEDVIAAEKKAYGGDEFPIGLDWQLTDFMQRLGFIYPMDETGKPTGDTHYLKIRRRRPLSVSDEKPSTKPHAAESISQKSLARPWWKIW